MVTMSSKQVGKRTARILSAMALISAFFCLSGCQPGWARGPWWDKQEPKPATVSAPAPPPREPQPEYILGDDLLGASGHCASAFFSADYFTHRRFLQLAGAGDDVGVQAMLDNGSVVMRGGKLRVLQLVGGRTVIAEVRFEDDPTRT